MRRDAGTSFSRPVTAERFEELLVKRERGEAALEAGPSVGACLDEGARRPERTCHPERSEGAELLPAERSSPPTRRHHGYETPIHALCPHRPPASPAPAASRRAPRRRTPRRCRCWRPSCGGAGPRRAASVRGPAPPPPAPVRRDPARLLHQCRALDALRQQVGVLIHGENRHPVAARRRRARWFGSIAHRSASGPLPAPPRPLPPAARRMRRRRPGGARDTEQSPVPTLTTSGMTGHGRFGRTATPTAAAGAVPRGVADLVREAATSSPCRLRLPPR